MTTVSGPSGKLDRRGRSLPNLPTTSEAGLAGLKSNVRHTDACAGRYSSGILKSAFKKHRSGGKRHRLRPAIAAICATKGQPGRLQRQIYSVRI